MPLPDPANPAHSSHPFARDFVLDLARLGLLERTARIDTTLSVEADSGFALLDWRNAFGGMVRHRVVRADPPFDTEAFSLTAFDTAETAILTHTYRRFAEGGFERRPDDDPEPVSDPIATLTTRVG